jgi:hypothetical protein
MIVVVAEDVVEIVVAVAAVEEDNFYQIESEDLKH